jgi:hypothetical protein
MIGRLLCARVLIGGGLLLVAASEARAFTYSDWLEAPAEFRHGYVFGMMSVLSQHVSSTDASKEVAMTLAYQKCFSENKIRSKTALDIVEKYLARDPTASTNDMLQNVVLALRAACKRYFPE